MTNASTSKLAPAALALFGAATLLAWQSGTPGSLSAETEEDTTPAVAPEDVDEDEDGISDAQELVMGTNPSFSDSDGDGFSDLEEFARQSDANNASSKPTDSSVNVGMAARVQDGTLHVMTALYLRHDETAGYGIKLGIMIDGQLAQLPSQIYLHGSTFMVEDAQHPGDRIALLDTPYPALPIHELGQISFWSLATPSSTDEEAEVAVIDLFVDPEGPEIMLLDFLASGESIYRPLNVEEPSSSWSPGQICVQRSLNVGTVGPVTEHLVESATCETADAYCSPTCPSLSGTSFQVLDPLALLGG